MTAPADVAIRGAGELPALRRALIALGCASVAAGLAAVALVLSSDHVDDRGVTAALGLAVGWSFAGTGLLAWWRRPLNRTGALMVAAGFAWFLQSLGTANGNVLYTIGIACDALFPAVVGHLVLAYPSGRLQTRAERLVVAAGYVTTTVLQIPSLLFEEHPAGEPRNLLVIRPDQELSDRLDLIQFFGALFVIAVSLTIMWRRWRAATAPQRRVLAPVIWTSGVAFLVLAVAAGLDAVGAGVDALETLSILLLATVPFGFLAGLLRSRLAQADRIPALIARLGQAPGTDAVRAALAEALGDPSVAVAYWLPGPGRFVDAAGRPVTLPEGGWTEVELQGRRIAAIEHDPSLADQPQLSPRGRRCRGARARERAARRGAAGADRGAARVAGAARPRRRRRAAAPGARPARRRAGSGWSRSARSSGSRAGGRRATRSSPRCSTPRGRSSRRAWTSCASSPAGSIRPC